MKRRFCWLILVALASAALRGQLVWSRRAGRPQPEAGQPASPELKGHRWFAAVYDLINSRFEGKVLSQVRAWIVGQATGRVLELGVGTGANLPYYGEAESVVAVEPDPFMLQRARRRAGKLGLNVEFHLARAEALPFADNAFDTVVATLVFCTVADPDRALAEVHRVLKPSGTFRFIEHVRAPDGLLARVQDAVTPVWRRLGAGCHPNRRTAEAIEAAGFEIVQLEKRPITFVPLIAGVAKPK